MDRPPFLILDGMHPQATPKTNAVPAIKTQSIGSRDARGSTKMRTRCSNRASTRAAGVDDSFGGEEASSFSCAEEEEVEEEDWEEREGVEVEEGDPGEMEADEEERALLDDGDSEEK